MAKKASKARKFIETGMPESRDEKMSSRNKRTGPLKGDPKEAISFAVSQLKRKGMKESSRKR